MERSKFVFFLFFFSLNPQFIFYFSQKKHIVFSKQKTQLWLESSFAIVVAPKLKLESIIVLVHHLRFPPGLKSNITIVFMASHVRVVYLYFIYTLF
jgi:hypothetical protein